LFKPSVFLQGHNNKSKVKMKLFTSQAIHYTS